LFATQNQRNFHALDGSGYEVTGDKIVELNTINPQMAASLAKPLARWRRYVGERPVMMQKELRRVSATSGLSADVYEVVTKGLA
jgi:aminopeptidase N